MAGSSSSVEVVGGRELSETLGDAAADLGDVEAMDTAAGELLLAEARRRVPVQTGTLRGSLTNVRGTVVAGQSYGYPVNYGAPAINVKPQPFLTDSLDQTEAYVEVYADAADAALRKVHGA